MKKKIAAALAVTFALGVTSAFAANPFVDVPAKHWAYDAVSKLAQAGIVDGYGDGTFRGDKNITRYEMAQIVAKALAKEDKANAEQKALLNKLSAEFSEELDNLGVRVSKLEKNASSVKITADGRIRGFENAKIEKNGTRDTTKNSHNTFDQRIRFYVDGNVNEKVAFKSRLTLSNVSNDELKTAEDKSFTFDYGYFNFKNVIGGADLSVGRHDLVIGYSLVSDISGGYDGVKAYFGGDKVKAIVGYGDISSRTGSVKADGSLGAVGVDKGLDNGVGKGDIQVTTAEIKYTPSNNFQTIGTVYYSNTNGYNYEVYGLGAKAKLDSNFTLTGEYATNESSKLAANADDHAWNAMLGYKGANRANPGSFGVFVNYKKFGKNALDYKMNSNPVFQGISDTYMLSNGVKGLGYGVNYTLSKNVVVTATYEDLEAYKETAGVADRPGYGYVRADFWF